MRFDLPCGCRPCGCLCPEHSPTRLDDLCPRHAGAAVARWIGAECLALVSILLLIASAAVWTEVLAGAHKRAWTHAPQVHILSAQPDGFGGSRDR